MNSEICNKYLWDLCSYIFVLSMYFIMIKYNHFNVKLSLQEIVV